MRNMFKRAMHVIDVRVDRKQTAIYENKERYF